MEVDWTKGRDAAPNQTIYVRNLSEKLKKEDLRRALYECFSTYGRVMDIVALKTMKMRGQAFVAFEDVASAANAMRHTQGLMFFDKPMVVQFAREKCKRISRALNGTTGSAQQAEKRKREEGNVERESEEKRAKPTSGEAKAAPVRDAPADGEAPTNKILFVQNIPDDVDADTLEQLFGEFRGFVEVRSAAGRKGIAFIEFESLDSAEIALKGMQGFKVSADNALVIAYANT